jgi:hypothetical protein
MTAMGAIDLIVVQSHIVGERRCEIEQTRQIRMWLAKDLWENLDDWCGSPKRQLNNFETSTIPSGWWSASYSNAGALKRKVISESHELKLGLSGVMASQLGHSGVKTSETKGLS